jgi:hypothetical protein
VQPFFNFAADMRNTLYISFILLLSLLSCKKNSTSPRSGTITINNILYGTGPYYAMGFAVTSGKTVSTLKSPLDVITINADFDVNYNVRKIYLATINFNNSFYRYGKYADASSASAAFGNLKSFTEPSSWAETGDSIKPNQIWIYKTSNSAYVKLKVTATVAEKRDSKPYAECTFDWVYQPDGTYTFHQK